MTPEHDHECECGHEYPAAGPCDLPAYGWADYQRARERFLRRLAAQSRAASPAPGPAAEGLERGDSEPAPVSAAPF